MKIARNCLFVLVGCSLLAWAGSAMAQIVPPGASQRDCQTIRTCNFARGGSYRGCLSSYSCRVCRLIRTALHHRWHAQDVPGDEVRLGLIPQTCYAGCERGARYWTSAS